MRNAYGSKSRNTVQSSLATGFLCLSLRHPSTRSKGRLTLLWAETRSTILTGQKSDVKTYVSFSKVFWRKG